MTCSDLGREPDSLEQTGSAGAGELLDLEFDPDRVLDAGTLHRDSASRLHAADLAIAELWHQHKLLEQLLVPRSGAPARVAGPAARGGAARAARGPIDRCSRGIGPELAGIAALGEEIGEAHLASTPTFALRSSTAPVRLGRPVLRPPTGPPRGLVATIEHLGDVIHAFGPRGGVAHGGPEVDVPKPGRYLAHGDTGLEPHGDTGLEQWVAQ